MKTRQVAQTLLHRLFDYNGSDLVWKVNKGHKKAGEIAGCIAKNGKTFYRIIGIDGKTYQAHRLIWMFHHGSIPKDKIIDHINHNGTDNRLENLRLASQSQNLRNRQLNFNNSSGITGVSKNKKTDKWSAYICHNNTRINLGSFFLKEQAINKRKLAEELLYVDGFAPS